MVLTSSLVLSLLLNRLILFLVSLVLSSLVLTPLLYRLILMMRKSVSEEHWPALLLEEPEWEFWT